MMIMMMMMATVPDVASRGPKAHSDFFSKMAWKTNRKFWFHSNYF